MAHLGVLCYHGVGHLNPFLALSTELVSRGHEVTFFLPRECEAKIREGGFGFVPVRIADPVQDHRAADIISSSGSSAGIRARLTRIDHEIGVYLREYLACIRASRVDALLVGEIALAGPIAAEILQKPYLMISTSIPLNFGWRASQVLADGTPHQEDESVLFESTISSAKGPIRDILDRYRRHVGLGPISDLGSSFPELAHITQWPECLDIPRDGLPERFFYTGPFVPKLGRPSIAFPWCRLTGQPLVYASLGTTQKAEPALYHRIAEACVGLDVQLVITLGGRRKVGEFADLPGHPLVVENAPQIELLELANVVITHAGPNTVLETLRAGKPMLALPIALDQPAVAAHLQRLGLAEVLCARDCSAADVRDALLKLMTSETYLIAVRVLQAQLQSLNGAALAATIIESAIGQIGLAESSPSNYTDSTSRFRHEIASSRLS